MKQGVFYLVAFTFGIYAVAILIPIAMCTVSPQPCLTTEQHEDIVKELSALLAAAIALYAGNKVQ